MANQKVNHNVWQPFVDQALGAADGATQASTSEWWDCNGWTDKRVSWEVDSAGTIDFNITMHISPQGYYELNNKTCTTDDYEAVTIVDAHTTAILSSKDAADVDELQRPFRSVRFIIDNDQAEVITAANVWLEGWS